MITSSRILLVAALLLLVGVFARPGLVELRGEEPLRAVVAMEMAMTDQYVVPHVNGGVYYLKPPLFNWTIASLFELFGRYETWLVRLPGRLAMVLLAGLCFIVGRRHLPREQALWSALMVFSAAELLFYGSVVSGEIDLVYAAITAAQVSVIGACLLERRWTWLFVGSYALAAAAFLTKAMPTLAFQALTLLVVLPVFGRARLLWGWQHLLGLGVFALLVGGYLLAYAQYEPVLPLLVALFKEAAQRTGLESHPEELAIGVLRFPLTMAQLLAPWSLLALVFLRADARRAVWANPWTRFCLVFCAANLPLYWISGELRHRYVYMFFPFLIMPIVHATFGVGLGRPRVQRAVHLVCLGLLGAGLVGAVVLPFVMASDSVAPHRLAFVLWALGLLVALLSAWRRPALSLALVLLALGTTRCAFDAIYLPLMAQGRDARFAEHVDAVLAITGERPLFIGGPPYRYTRDASIGPWTFGEFRYEVPPILAYQVSWQYGRRRGEPLRWAEEGAPGAYCLVRLSSNPDDWPPTLYAYDDHWVGRRIGLLRCEDLALIPAPEAPPSTPTASDPTAGP